MNLDESIGEKIRDLRNKNGLTQEELADRTELTKGFISQLERGLSSASVATLSDIVTALGTNLSDFFKAESVGKITFSDEDYFLKTDESGNTTEWLVPSAQGMSLEPIRLVIKPDTATPEDSPHEGEEFGYVVQGKIYVHYGDKVYKVSRGESFCYKSDRVHFLSSASKKDSVVLWVSCPPSF